MAKTKKVATDFEKIINEGRERKKNEALADRIFSKNRRQSAPSKLGFKSTSSPSLASRVGVRKVQQRADGRGARSNAPGNVNGEWTHDLHHSISGDLSARISAPNGPNGPNKRANNRRTARLSAAVDRMDTSADAPQQVNIVKPKVNGANNNSMGITIRGLAGPFTVMAQNFAPGTTPADIESAMTPIGGEIVSCRIVKSKPILIFELAFASREGGERVIETFNDKTADGRIIKVYPKLGAPTNITSPNPPRDAPSGPRGNRANRLTKDNIVDGSMGFPDLMQTAATNDSSRNNQLYSDNLADGNRRGRGGPRGRGGR
ncbi:unnamed protein product [Fusarium graminearum]|nr:hypothetical protein FG05_05419 [Fusarium graminearum]KAI6757347.1 hypothetical protein HG531_003172 [Fusarium graminearum]PCD40298.1 hypothetical protein FGRA07_01569 [Fusarium graminearum]CAG1962117.1 unnamed protein product [Fusarium graminearum]CAG1968782.1 unnamed protein product [Fusarium graminearum]